MGTALDAQAWRDIDTLIRNALQARETYRTGPKNPRTTATTWKPIMQLLAKFPEGTFTKNDHKDIANINPYGKEDNSGWAALFRDVTNDAADDNLITTDTTARPGLVNSPRAAMAAHAWVITNSMCGSGEVAHAIANRARQLWERRCGPFVVAQN
ncbi:hypothetical protein NCS52_01505700 [Fusarium sp. LHS14.1]|nr:hypothetical protein NCS52_01505700 [Fusarium sp. LHS14.1]